MTASPMTQHLVHDLRTELAWRPHHTWQPHWTWIRGQLGSGGLLDIVTWNDPFLDPQYRPAALHLWGNGEVLLGRKCGRCATLVLPVHALECDVVVESVRRQ